MPIRLIQEVTFGANGSDAPHLGEGWSADEPGYRWSIGPSSELWLPSPGDGELLLELEVSPFVCPPAIQAQRLVIHADDVLVGSMCLREGGRRALRVPSGTLAGRQDIRLSFMHPDAGRPSDYGNTTDARQLALSFKRLSLFGIESDARPKRREARRPRAAAVSPEAEAATGPKKPRKATPSKLPKLRPPRLDGAGGLAMEDVEGRAGMTPGQLVTQFESLGDNCEFGLVQRRCGAEPLSLLRFSNIEMPQLLRAVDVRFAGLGESDNLSLSLSEGPKREFVLRDSSFALTFHTFQYQGEAQPGPLLAQQSQRLKFLRRKLLEDLDSGEKIFVVRRFQPLMEQEVLPLCAALSQHGPCKLLWIALADAAHPPGTVEQVMPGLLRGRLDRFAPDANAHDMSFEIWLEVCANALKLARR